MEKGLEREKYSGKNKKYSPFNPGSFSLAIEKERMKGCSLAATSLREESSDGEHRRWLHEGDGHGAGHGDHSAPWAHTV